MVRGEWTPERRPLTASSTTNRHGRDNKLIVWKLAADDEIPLSTKLPLDPSPEPRPQPWILHMLEVNTMNFCSFSHCPASPGSSTASSEILVAVPNTLASEAVSVDSIPAPADPLLTPHPQIDIFHLPSQARQHTVKLGDKNGMVMALSLLHQGPTLTLVAGYENGLAAVAQLDDHNRWSVTYQAKCHSQPILSLDVAPDGAFFLTSSADAIIAKHPLPTTTTTTIQTAPLKTLNTKHAGQQSLRIRSDARLFATAGWDARVRVYSAKTLAEVAVLKWHTAGCYAAAFAAVDSPVGDDAGGAEASSSSSGSSSTQDAAAGAGKEVAPVAVPRLVEMTVREKRERQVRTAHWLVAGSKDGKVSLWDVF